MASFARELERENARLRAALEDLSSTVGGYLHGKEWHHWKEHHAARFAEALANIASQPRDEPTHDKQKTATQSR